MTRPNRGNNTNSLPSKQILTFQALHVDIDRSEGNTPAIIVENTGKNLFFTLKSGRKIRENKPS